MANINFPVLLLPSVQVEAISVCFLLWSCHFDTAVSVSLPVGQVENNTMDISKHPLQEGVGFPVCKFIWIPRMGKVRGGDSGGHECQVLYGSVESLHCTPVTHMSL